MLTKPNQYRKAQDLLRRADPKPYKVHQLSLFGKVASSPEARFATLEAAKRYVRPRRLVAIYKDRKRIWPKS
jgi:hypothetical protein